MSLEYLIAARSPQICVELSPGTRISHPARRRSNEFPPHTLEVRAQDVFAVIPPLIANGQQFDLILADPPYGEKNVGRRSISHSPSNSSMFQTWPVLRARQTLRAQARTPRHFFWKFPVVEQKPKS
ncbi:MAG: hypothetical protein U1F83_06465 [Verrucomicrobiota bacterium]